MNFQLGMKNSFLLLALCMSLTLLLVSFSHRTKPYVDNEITGINDRYLHLFSEERQLDKSEGCFTGFPKAVVHKGIIYVTYAYQVQHQSTPGKEQDFIYYRSSRDGGQKWSTRQRLIFPKSKIKGISYDYRSIQMISDGNRILGLGTIVPSDTSRIKPYSTFYCELKPNKRGKLKVKYLSLMPYVEQEGNEILSAKRPGEGERGSNIVSGNIILHDGYLYWCYYNSVRNVQLLRWKTTIGKHPEVETIEILASIGDNNKNHQYSEVGMFLEGESIFLSVRDEKATNSNWRYDLLTGEMIHIGNTKTSAFGPNIYKPKEGPVILTGRQYTYLKKREQLTRMDNIILRCI